MTTKTEGAHPGEFIVSEANGNRSRDVATLVAGQNLAAGAVLGLIGSGGDAGKYSAYDDGNSDGTETAVAILYAATDATDADTECTIIARDAEVNGETLAFASGVDEAGAIVDLAAEGIIVR